MGCKRCVLVTGWQQQPLSSDFKSKIYKSKIMTHAIYLSLGSNLGDRLTNLHNAISCLPPKIQPVIQSSVYETEPWGYTDQPAFLNQVIKAGTALHPTNLL